MHPLHEALVAAAHGEFPPVDGCVEVHPPGPDGVHVVAEFTGHAYVLTHRRSDDLLALGVDGFGGVARPDVIRWLAGPSGTIGSHDVVLVATGRRRVGTTGGLPEVLDLDEHPRVLRARRHRRDVRVHGDERGFVTIGNGLVDRLEVSVELLGAPAGDRAGRQLIAAGLALIDAGTLVWAQVAPGNAASLRAFLHCGFRPIGAETLIAPSR